MFNHLLLCTHGTPGAQIAENLVFAELAGKQASIKITVLTVINEDWKLMTGDDWLNTSTTRNTFIEHVDSQLSQEIEADWQRIKARFPRAESCRFIRTMGPIEQTICKVAAENGCDLIVIGPFQKKQGKGFKARMKNKTFHPLLTCPLLVASKNLALAT
jgi:nucleotide-binding universal stress UspA family protein